MSTKLVRDEILILRPPLDLYIRDFLYDKVLHIMSRPFRPARFRHLQQDKAVSAEFLAPVHKFGRRIKFWISFGPLKLSFPAS